MITNLIFRFIKNVSCIRLKKYSSVIACCEESKMKDKLSSTIYKELTNRFHRYTPISFVTELITAVFEI